MIKQEVLNCLFSNWYPLFREHTIKSIVISIPEDFVYDVIIDKFPNDSFTVDLYKKRDGRFWIIDFNPFGEMTESLLFTWAELSSGDLSDFNSSVSILDSDVTIGQFRYTPYDVTMQPSENLRYRVPQDFVDLSTGSDATKLIDFMRMKLQNGEADDSSDDEQWTLPVER
uniref:Translation initiation factor eIF2 assembly protein n=1 Tax=Ciona savignyi TaxID=51511 RepID=H2YTA9_CIOSA